MSALETIRSHVSRKARSVLAGAVSGLGLTAAAQCPNDWIPTDGFPGAGVEPLVYAATSWDPDGAGPQSPRLVAGGIFQYMTNRLADSIASLNPTTGQWEDLAGGVDSLIEEEEGTFDQAVVASLTVFQDDLIVGGVIGDAGGVAVNNIARWDGTSWSALGTGLLGFPTSMTVYNGELIAAGTFVITGDGTTVNRIARWNGTAWLPLGSPAGLNGPVNNVAVYNGELIAVGNFSTAGGVPANRIARWNGAQWQALGTGLNDGGFGLTVLGDDLYVGGNFSLAGGVPNTRGVARWDGANWHPVGGGALFAVGALATYHDDIVAGGVFIVTLEGERVEGLARFDTASQTWQVMGGGFCCGGGPTGFAVHNDELVVVGGYREIANRSAYGIAHWSETTQAWDRFAPGFDWTPSHFTTYRGDLIAGGGFSSAGNANANGVARWDGQEWHGLAGGIGHLSLPTVDSLQVYNDELYVGGNFHSVDGANVSVRHIAKWNGATETWSDVGGGVSGVELPRVQALAVYNGELIAAGDFNFAGGVPAQCVARWDGSQWRAMGDGLPTIVLSLIVFNGDLFASTQSVGLQRWDGSDWHQVPGGPASSAMVVYNGQLLAGAWDPFIWDGTNWTMLPGWSWDPNGAAVGNFDYAVFEGDLIVAGQFENAAGIPEADGLVRFDGTSWSAMTTESGVMSSITSALGVHNGELFTNGRIEHVDGSMSNWRRFGPICRPGDLDGDGDVDLSDLAALLADFGCAASCAGDTDGDGDTDLSDLTLLLANYGL